MNSSAWETCHPRQLVTLLLLKTDPVELEKKAGYFCSMSLSQSIFTLDEIFQVKNEF